MEIILVLVIVAAAAFAFLAMQKGAATGEKLERNKGAQTPIKAKRLLTANEQPTFSRLVEALPEYVIFAQVSFSAIITSTGQSTRNKFNRKMADFVVCDKAFNVVAVVELDDSSHNGREEKDADRDALLKEAGHKVIRYKQTPDKEQIRKDFGL